jgi:hypothetical protein
LHEFIKLLRVRNSQGLKEADVQRLKAMSCMRRKDENNDPIAICPLNKLQIDVIRMPIKQYKSVLSRGGWFCIRFKYFFQLFEAHSYRTPSIGCYKSNGPKVKGPKRSASIDDSKLKRKGGKVSKRLARNLYPLKCGQGYTGLCASLSEVF